MMQLEMGRPSTALRSPTHFKLLMGCNPNWTHTKPFSFDTSNETAPDNTMTYHNQTKPTFLQFKTKILVVCAWRPASQARTSWLGAALGGIGWTSVGKTTCFHVRSILPLYIWTVSTQEQPNQAKLFSFPNQSRTKLIARATVSHQTE